MSTFEITLNNDKVDVVDAWAVHEEKGVATFTDGRGETVAIYVGFRSIRKLPDTDEA